MKNLLTTTLLFLLWLVACSESQTTKPVADSTVKHTFTDSLVLPSSPVRDQGRGGNCWAYGVVGMWESEALSKGDTLDLSELWLVRKAWREKAIKFVRTRGRVGFSQGGELQDAVALAARYGVVEEGDIEPREVNFSRLQRRVRWWAYKSWLLKRYREKGWESDLEQLLDEELGSVATVKAHPLAEKAYRAYTSFTHHPYYTDFTLEIPDNWMGHKSHNLPLDELIERIDSSLRAGYTVGWNTDTSERGFRPHAGWADLPKSEREVTAERRQEAFDCGLTTDDHIMQLVGIAYRDDGRRFYKVRNSWGEIGPYGGYLYASEEYVRMKTIEVLIQEE